MTRGKIIYIDKDCKAYSTVEFNGDIVKKRRSNCGKEE